MRKQNSLEKKEREDAPHICKVAVGFVFSSREDFGWDLAGGMRKRNLLVKSTADPMHLVIQEKIAMEYLEPLEGLVPLRDSLRIRLHWMLLTWSSGPMDGALCSWEGRV